MNNLHLTINNVRSSDLSLPTKPRHQRKTFATDTLKKINLRLGYYRKVLKNNNISNQRRERINKKYERDIKIRILLNRAVSNLYK